MRSTSDLSRTLLLPSSQLTITDARWGILYNNCARLVLHIEGNLEKIETLPVKKAKFLIIFNNFFCFFSDLVKFHDNT